MIQCIYSMISDQEIDDPDDYTTIEETERSLNHRPLPPTPTALRECI